jgi:hypothetical protein
VINTTKLHKHLPYVPVILQKETILIRTQNAQFHKSALFGIAKNWGKNNPRIINTSINGENHSSCRQHGTM